MKLSEIIALVVAVLGLAGAFQGFFAVDLFSKLIALAAGESIVLWVAARRLKDWGKTKPSPGFAQLSSRPRLKLGSMILAPGIICLFFSMAAWFVLWLYAINIETSNSGDRVVFWIHGSRQATEKLLVSYPRATEAECRPETDPNYRASTAMVEPDGPNPRLDIRNFAYPQSQGLSCLKGTTVKQLRFEPKPSTVEILNPERRLTYETCIFIFGGILWIASIFYVVFQSR